MTSSIYTLEHLVEKERIYYSQNTVKSSAFMLHFLYSSKNVVKNKNVSNSKNASNVSTYILNFFKVILGSVAIVIALLILGIPLIYFNIYFKLKASKLSKIKLEVFNSIKMLSFSEIKNTENKISELLLKFSQFEKQLSTLKNISLFKGFHSSIFQMVTDLKEINNELSNSYTYSENELSEEEMIASVNYWNKVKLNNPNIFEILSKDSSTEESTNNAKKFQNELC